ncbi:MAG: hypothetical protein KAR07_03105 [Spirochaetes bacterium]|nr:hypothetical protein [Spirochaetota bacterium]
MNAEKSAKSQNQCPICCETLDAESHVLAPTRKIQKDGLHFYRFNCPECGKFMILERACKVLCAKEFSADDRKNFSEYLKQQQERGKEVIISQKFYEFCTYNKNDFLKILSKFRKDKLGIIPGIDKIEYFE